VDTTQALKLVNNFGCRVFEAEHFVYKSFKHGPAYINVDPVLYKPSAIEAIAKLLAEPYLPLAGDEIEIVADPAVGAIPFGHDTAQALTQGYQPYYKRMYDYQSAKRTFGVLHVFAEKHKRTDGSETFHLDRTGFADVCKGKNILVVEDILNSGTSTRGVIECVRAAGGIVMGVSCFVNRGGVTAESLGVNQLNAIIDINMVQYEASECPLCKSNVPIIADPALGKGSDFAVKHPDYAGGFKYLLE